MPSDVNQVQKAKLKLLQDPIMARKETTLDININMNFLMHLTLHFSTVHIIVFTDWLTDWLIGLIQMQ